MYVPSPLAIGVLTRLRDGDLRIEVERRRVVLIGIPRVAVAIRVGVGAVIGQVDGVFVGIAVLTRIAGRPRLVFKRRPRAVGVEGQGKADGERRAHRHYLAGGGLHQIDVTVTVEGSVGGGHGGATGL